MSNENEIERLRRELESMKLLMERQKEQVGGVMYHLRHNAHDQVVQNPAYYQMLYDRLGSVGFKEIDS